MSARDTVRRRQLRAIKLYRLRARIALAKAHEARGAGLTTALRGYVSEARIWHRFACEWAQRSRQELPSILRRQAG